MNIELTKGEKKAALYSLREAQPRIEKRMIDGIAPWGAIAEEVMVIESQCGRSNDIATAMGRYAAAYYEEYVGPVSHGDVR